MHGGVAAAVLVAAATVGVAGACFITNCPPGGSTSLPCVAGCIGRQCSSCGPGLLGRCLGPDICCGPAIGCYLATRETSLCRTENLVPLSCSNQDLVRCGRRGEDGRCAAYGLCCTHAKCVRDDTCGNAFDAPSMPQALPEDPPISF